MPIDRGFLFACTITFTEAACSNVIVKADEQGMLLRFAPNY